MGAFEKIFGTHSERELKRIKPLVDKIEDLRPTMQGLSDEELKAKTAEFKKRLEAGETMDDILVGSICRSQRGILARASYGAIPCTVDRRYYFASRAYCRDENG